MKKTLEERFFEKVEVTDNCWEWKAHKLYNGYGRFSFMGKTEYSHRVAWLMYYGEIPLNKSIIHICDNPGCVRKEHLSIGTVSDNLADRNKKNRQYNLKKIKCRHGVQFKVTDGKRIAPDCVPCARQRRYNGMYRNHKKIAKLIAQ